MSQMNVLQIRLVKTLFVAIFFLFVLYLYFVNSAAFNAAAQERVASEIYDLQVELSELEFDFIEENKEIKKEMAGDFNLIVSPDSDIAFVRRDQAAKLSLNE